MHDIICTHIFYVLLPNAMRYKRLPNNNNHTNFVPGIAETPCSFLLVLLRNWACHGANKREQDEKSSTKEKLFIKEEQICFFSIVVSNGKWQRSPTEFYNAWMKTNRRFISICPPPLILDTLIRSCLIIIVIFFSIHSYTIRINKDMGSIGMYMLHVFIYIKYVVECIYDLFIETKSQKWRKEMKLDRIKRIQFLKNTCVPKIRAWNRSCFWIFWQHVVDWHRLLASRSVPWNFMRFLIFLCPTSTESRHANQSI